MITVINEGIIFIIEPYFLSNVNDNIFIKLMKLNLLMFIKDKCESMYLITESITGIVIILFK